MTEFIERAAGCSLGGEDGSSVQLPGGYLVTDLGPAIGDGDGRSCPPNCFGMNDVVNGAKRIDCKDCYRNISLEKTGN